MASSTPQSGRRLEKQPAPTKPDVFNAIAAFVFSGGQSSSNVEKLRAKRHAWLAARKNPTVAGTEAASDKERERERDRIAAGVGSSAEHGAGTDEVPPPYVNDVPDYSPH